MPNISQANLKKTKQNRLDKNNLSHLPTKLKKHKNNFAYIAFLPFFCALLALNAALLSGCKDEASQSIDSSDLDKNSYSGLEHIFKDTKEISPDGKYMLLIFGANGCKYCENLKNDIKQDKALQKTIGEDFSAYYINLSYAKIHNFKIAQESTPNTTQKGIKEVKLPTKKLAQIYAVSPTPTIVLSSKEGQTILQYPSYLPPAQFMALLDFITSEKWREAKDDEKKLNTLVQKELQKAWEQNNF